MAVATGGLVTLGSVSTTVTVPVVGPAPALLIVMVQIAPVCPRVKVPAWVLVMVRSAGCTVKVAVAVLPVPPLVELTAPVVLTYVPAAEEVTLTLTVQLLLVATVPPVSEMLPDPAVAVAVPPQVLVSPFGVATISPAGRLSVTAAPVSAAALAAGLVMVRVKVEVPLTAMAAGLKALAMEGGPSTLRLAEAVPPVPPS